MTDQVKTPSPLMGLTVLGCVGKFCLGVADKQDVEMSMHVLTGRFDDDIRALLAMNPDISGPFGNTTVEVVKERIRQAVQGIFEQADEEERNRRILQQEALRLQLQTEFLQHNQQHPLGTVAQLATKFNVSKGEIRRRKQDGTLDSWINERSKESLK